MYQNLKIKEKASACKHIYVMCQKTMFFEQVCAQQLGILGTSLRYGTLSSN